MFSTAAWDRNQPLYDTIVQMPFNTELAAGTLSQSRFRQYMIQDAHYLEGFARALSYLSAKSTSLTAIARFADAAKTAIMDERSLHTDFFDRFGITDSDYRAAQPTPACDHYVSYLLRTAALDSYEVGLAAILPCFWIYSEVGKHIHRTAATPNPYQAWIDLYSSDDFEAEVQDMITATDSAASNASEATLGAMHAAFTRATQLEWMFWDSAYRLEDWPVGV